jgi:hypothetical protein
VLATSSSIRPENKRVSKQKSKRQQHATTSGYHHRR